MSSQTSPCRSCPRSRCHSLPVVPGRGVPSPFTRDVGLQTGPRNAAVQSPAALSLCSASSLPLLLPTQPARAQPAACCPCAVRGGAVASPSAPWQQRPFSWSPGSDRAASAWDLLWLWHLGEARPVSQWPTRPTPVAPGRPPSCPAAACRRCCGTHLGFISPRLGEGGLASGDGSHWKEGLLGFPGGQEGDRRHGGSQRWRDSGRLGQSWSWGNCRKA